MISMHETLKAVGLWRINGVLLAVAGPVLTTVLPHGHGSWVLLLDFFLLISIACSAVLVLLFLFDIFLRRFINFISPINRIARNFEFISLLVIGAIYMVLS